MTGAHDEKVIERAFDIAAFLLASLEVPLEENGLPPHRKKSKISLSAKGIRKWATPKMTWEGGSSYE